MDVEGVVVAYEPKSNQIKARTVSHRKIKLCVLFFEMLISKKLNVRLSHQINLLIAHHLTYHHPNDHLHLCFIPIFNSCFLLAIRS
jgi:hypothetical protein